MSTLPSILDGLISRIKDRHQSLSSKLHRSFYEYPIWDQDYYITDYEFSQLIQQTETADGSSAVSSLFKLFSAVLMRTEYARIQGRNPYVRNRLYIEEDREL